MTLALPWLAAVLTAALLFLLLRRDAASPAPRRALFFSLLGALAAASLIGSRVTSAPSRGAVGVAFREYTQASVEAKTVGAGIALLSQGNVKEKGSWNRAIRLYRRAVAAAPESARFPRELAIVLGEAGRRPEALRAFEKAAASLRRRGEMKRAAEEADLWPRIYGGARPRRADVARLRARVEALELGWFRYLALAALYERAGLRREAEEQRDAARDEAMAQYVTLGLIGAGMFVIGLLGIVVSVVWIVQARRGEWRPVGGDWSGSPTLLWETFILFMFVNAAQSLMRGLIPGMPRAGSAASERAVLAVIAAVLAGDLLSLTPLLYLAVMLRRSGETLASIGLTARGGLIECCRGIVTYVGALPWIFAVAGLTSWLGERVFPNVAPPFHPVQALTLAAGSGWARFGLFLVVAVGAPVVEEIFFRGVLYGALRRRFGKIAALIGSAAFFSLLHPQLPLGFLPIFFLGVLLAGLYEWRRSLLPGIAFHAVNNGLLFLFISLLFPPLE